MPSLLNYLDPEADFVAGSRGDYPPPMTKEQMFLNVLFGDRSKPITAEDFNPYQLRELERLIAQKGGNKGNIQYKDYPNIDKMGAVAGNPDLDMFANVLGRFTYDTLPDGTRVIKDNYDFNNPQRKKIVEGYESVNPFLKPLIAAARATNAGALKGLKGAASEIGMAYIGNDGRPVDIRYNPSGLLDANADEDKEKKLQNLLNY